MPKALKKYKNVSEFIKGAAAFKKEMEKKYKLPAKDVARFEKVMSDKTGIEKTYMALVEEDPKLLKIAGDIEKIDKAIKTLAKAEVTYTKVDRNLVEVSKAIKRMVDAAGGDRKQLAGNDNYKKLNAYLDKTAQEWDKANKQVKQLNDLRKQVAILQASYDKEKDKIAKTYGVTLKTDAKSLVVIMGKTPEMSISLGG